MNNSESLVFDTVWITTKLTHQKALIENETNCDISESAITETI